VRVVDPGVAGVVSGGYQGEKQQGCISVSPRKQPPWGLQGTTQPQKNQSLTLLVLNTRGSSTCVIPSSSVDYQPISCSRTAHSTLGSAKWGYSYYTIYVSIGQAARACNDRFLTISSIRSITTAQDTRDDSHASFGTFEVRVDALGASPTVYNNQINNHKNRRVAKTIITDVILHTSALQTYMCMWRWRMTTASTYAVVMRFSPALPLPYTADCPNLKSQSSGVSSEGIGEVVFISCVASDVNLRCRPSNEDTTASCSKNCCCHPRPHGQKHRRQSPPIQAVVRFRSRPWLGSEQCLGP
jgi:hypothetical protein